MFNIYNYRYNAGLSTTLLKSGHSTKSNRKCGKLTQSDVKKYHAAFYHTPTKEDQDAFISNY